MDDSLVQTCCNAGEKYSLQTCQPPAWRLAAEPDFLLETKKDAIVEHP